MKYRAIAVPTERSNAVGTVELECRPEGLMVSYLGVATFSEGYAPAAITQGSRLCVPWASIECAELEGQRLFLAFDPALGPHCRLLLGNFSSGGRVHHHELYRRRVLVRVSGLGGAAIVAILTLSAVARLSPDRGPALAIAVAVLSAAAILIMAFFADRLLAFGGLSAEAARQALTGELLAYLPSLTAVPVPPPRAKPARTLADFQGLIPRTTFAIVVTLTASGLGAVVMARYLMQQEPEGRDAPPRELRTTEETSEPEPALASQAPPPTRSARTTPSASPATATSEPSTAGSDAALSLGEPCRCRRADSPLWAEPLPRLSILVLSHRVRRGRGEGESLRKNYTELEVAVVNNGDQEIKEVALVVLFYSRDEGKERELISNRPLFFEGPLLPAQAIKWSVEAEGSEFEIQNSILGTIGDDGENAAPADRAAELLLANHRPVRLHGALLLTLLGDRRAKEGLLRLREALREDEAPYLDRLLDAQREVRVCNLRPPASGVVRGCLHNATAEPKRDLGVKLRALAALPNHELPTAEPPALLGESVLSVPGELAADAGVVFSGRFAAPAGAAAYEAVADRIDLLR